MAKDVPSTPMSPSRSTSYSTSTLTLPPWVVSVVHVVTAAELWGVAAIVVHVADVHHRESSWLFAGAVVSLAVLVWSLPRIAFVAMKSQVNMLNDRIEFRGLLGTSIHAGSNLQTIDYKTIASRGKGAGPWAVFNFGPKGKERVQVGRIVRLQPLIVAIQSTFPNVDISRQWVR